MTDYCRRSRPIPKRQRRCRCTHRDRLADRVGLVLVHEGDDLGAMSHLARPRTSPKTRTGPARAHPGRRGQGGATRRLAAWLTHHAGAERPHAPFSRRRRQCSGPALPAARSRMLPAALRTRSTGASRAERRDCASSLVKLPQQPNSYRTVVPHRPNALSTTPLDPGAPGRSSMRPRMFCCAEVVRRSVAVRRGSASQPTVDSGNTRQDVAAVATSRPFGSRTSASATATRLPGLITRPVAVSSSPACTARR